MTVKLTVHSHLLWTTIDQFEPRNQHVYISALGHSKCESLWWLHCDMEKFVWSAILWLALSQHAVQHDHGLLCSHTGCIINLQTTLQHTSQALIPRWEDW